MDMLDHFLAKFYQHRVEGNSEIYDISKDSKGLLLLYVLIVAVLAEDGEMSAETFEGLRGCLRMASTEMTSRLRSVFIFSISLGARLHLCTLTVVPGSGLSPCLMPPQATLPT